MAPTTAQKKLRKRLRALPQAIFDRIKDLTLSFDATTITRVVNKYYRPPIQLQINHQLRQKCLPIYYGTPAVWTFQSQGLIDRWLRSLSLFSKVFLCIAGIPVANQQKQADQKGEGIVADFRVHVTHMTEGLEVWRLLTGVSIAHKVMRCWIHIEDSASVEDGLKVHGFQIGKIGQFEGMSGDGMSEQLITIMLRNEKGITGRRSKMVRRKVREMERLGKVKLSG